MAMHDPNSSWAKRDELVEAGYKFTKEADGENKIWTCRDVGDDSIIAHSAYLGTCVTKAATAVGI